MNRVKKIYQCQTCKQVVEKVYETLVPLMCCTVNMKEQIAQTKDSSVEKHVPFVESVEKGKILVRIGENQEHPMTDEHYIQFIEVITKSGIVLRYDLEFFDKPEVEFDVDINDILQVREFCNVHGLWKR